MKRLLAPFVALVAAVTLAACQAQTEVAPAKLAENVKPAVKAPPTDLEQLAQRLVTQSAAV
jgi:outer membrane biogenesis lipoprotein LolB